MVAERQQRRKKMKYYPWHDVECPNANEIDVECEACASVSEKSDADFCVWDTDEARWCHYCTSCHDALGYDD
jgi:hypothetical protein